MRDIIERSEVYTQFEVLKEYGSEDVWEVVLLKGKKSLAWVAGRYFKSDLGLKFRNLVYGKKIWFMDSEHFKEESEESLVITEVVKSYEQLYD